MGNYENLKQSITEVIRTNGNQEITGALLQSTLLTIISTVGANATFVGIATPTTNPGTPDGSVFYLASESGTYSNFGSVELQDGLSVLMWNGSWSSQQIFGVDDEPTAGSDNLVKSGGVFNNIGAIDVSELNATENPHTLATYEDLTSALNALPTSYRKGGMMIKFVQSTDDKYVQFRCMAQDFTTDLTQWQGVDEEPKRNSCNLVESDGIYNELHKVEIVTLSVNPTKIASNGRIGSDGLFVSASGYGIRTFATKLQAGLYKLTYSAVGGNSINTVALYEAVVANSSQLTSENLIKVINYTETPSGTEYIVEFEVLEGEEGYLSFSFNNNANPTCTVYSIKIINLLNSLQEQINNKLPYSFRRYLEGGYAVTNTPSLVDEKIAATLYSIITAQPDADIYVVDNYNGGYNNWSSPNRTYANELKAFADWFCIGFLSLKDSGIRERVSGQRRTFTADGLHAYTEAGATRIYNRIIGQLLQRYACDIQNIINKKILLLGDSTSIVGSPTSWAKMLNDVCSSVTNMSMGGTGWIDNNEGSGRNVLEQFNAAPSDNYDIIIISSGFNELHQFNLDYASAIEYCSNNYQEWG